MLKKLALCMAACLAAAGVALAGGFDQAELERTPDCQVYIEEMGVDTVVRPMDQPYMGTLDEQGGMLAAFVDWVEKPDEGMTFIRLTASVMSGQRIAASEIAITVGGETWVFTVQPVIQEYDTIYYEDYALCLTDVSLPMLKAMARDDAGVFPVELRGLETVQGTLLLPPQRLAEIYDRYADLGGLTQNLAICQDLWPARLVE